MGVFDKGVEGDTADEAPRFVEDEGEALSDVEDVTEDALAEEEGDSDKQEAEVTEFDDDHDRSRLELVTDRNGVLIRAEALPNA